MSIIPLRATGRRRRLYGLTRGALRREILRLEDRVRQLADDNRQVIGDSEDLRVQLDLAAARIADLTALAAAPRALPPAPVDAAPAEPAAPVKVAAVRFLGDVPPHELAASWQPATDGGAA